jgi:hypothetical protein
MRKTHKLISISVVLIILVCIGLFVCLIALPGFQRDGESGKQEEHNSIEKIDFQPSSNPTYKTTCGECHFHYPPELLPTGSWRKIVNQLDNHFGEQVPIDPPSKEVISKYLAENGADRSSSEISIKIMKSLKGQTPLRITEIPLFQKKHRGIKPEVLNRKSIGSLSNCIACHKTAEQGNFDEDNVTVPQ